MATLSEADTCRKYILPKLYAAGWEDDQISEQKTFTDGRRRHFRIANTLEDFTKFSAFLSHSGCSCRIAL